MSRTAPAGILGGTSAQEPNPIHGSRKGWSDEVTAELLEGIDRPARDAGDNAAAHAESSSRPSNNDIVEDRLKEPSLLSPMLQVRHGFSKSKRPKAKVKLEAVEEPLESPEQRRLRAAKKRLLPGEEENGKTRSRAPKRALKRPKGKPKAKGASGQTNKHTLALPPPTGPSGGIPNKKRKKRKAAALVPGNGTAPSSKGDDEDRTLAPSRRHPCQGESVRSFTVRRPRSGGKVPEGRELEGMEGSLAHVPNEGICGSAEQVEEGGEDCEFTTEELDSDLLIQRSPITEATLVTVAQKAATPPAANACENGSATMAASNPGPPLALPSIVASANAIIDGEHNDIAKPSNHDNDTGNKTCNNGGSNRINESNTKDNNEGEDHGNVDDQSNENNGGNDDNESSSKQDDSSSKQREGGPAPKGNGSNNGSSGNDESGERATFTSANRSSSIAMETDASAHALNTPATLGFPPNDFDHSSRAAAPGQEYGVPMNRRCSMLVPHLPLEAALPLPPAQASQAGHAAGPIKCPHEGCGREWPSTQALTKHMRSHGEKPYICHYENCAKRFSEKSKLTRHFLIHTGEKPFECPVAGCGKAFSLDFNLRSHLRTHTGEGFACPFQGCYKRYVHQYKLKAHIIHHHAQPPESADRLVGPLLKGQRLAGSEEDPLSDNDDEPRDEPEVAAMGGAEGAEYQRRRLEKKVLRLEAKRDQITRKYSLLPSFPPSLPLSLHPPSSASLWRLAPANLGQSRACCAALPLCRSGPMTASMPGGESRGQS